MGLASVFGSEHVSHHKSALVGKDDRLHAVAEIEFHQDTSDVSFDRALFHDEFRGDLRVRQTPGDEAQDFPLPSGQGRQL
jgi:hypothetical protein